MKKYVLAALMVCSLIILNIGQIFALKGFGGQGSIITKDPNKVFNLNLFGGLNNGRSIRVWAEHAINNPIEGNVSNVISPDITSHEKALQETLRLIQIIINRFLGMLSLTALIYLLYHGFLMLTAREDGKQFDKGKAGIKVAVIAISGIGISRFIISAIFRLINLVTS